VKHWQETERILDALLQVVAEGRAAALGRVVHVEGSAYRRPGAKLFVAEGGMSLGGVSGGCLEEDVRLVGLETSRTGAPQLRHYDTEESEGKAWGLGLGCGGKVDVFVQPVTPVDARGLWSPVRDRLRGSEPFAVGTIIAGPGSGRSLIVDEDGTTAADDGSLDADVARFVRQALRARTSQSRVLGERRIFAEVFLPPPRLLICGAGDDAIPLASCAATVGFRVLVADHRSASLTPERFPEATDLFLRRPEEGVPESFRGGDAFAVVKAHSFRLDREWVRALLGTETRYIGLLGPRARTERILFELEASVASRRESVYGPVGLDLGAEGSEQVALSIVAELMAVRSGREARSLREKTAAVHA
jgi:xanthine dehydrogenase accessory factor